MSLDIGSSSAGDCADSGLCFRLQIADMDDLALKMHLIFPLRTDQPYFAYRGYVRRGHVLPRGGLARRSSRRAGSCRRRRLQSAHSAFERAHLTALTGQPQLPARAADRLFDAGAQLLAEERAPNAAASLDSFGGRPTRRAPQPGGSAPKATRLPPAVFGVAGALPPSWACLPSASSSFRSCPPGARLRSHAARPRCDTRRQRPSFRRRAHVPRIRRLSYG